MHIRIDESGVYPCAVCYAFSDKKYCSLNIKSMTVSTGSIFFLFSLAPHFSANQNIPFFSTFYPVLLYYA